MLVDTNLLIYTTFVDTPEHAQARGWFEEQLGDPDASLCLCWPVVYAFVRLITSPRVFAEHALSVERGWTTVAEYLAQPAVRVVTAGPGHSAIAAELAATPGLRSEDVPDLEIAALAIEHGLVLATRDHGFRRFAHLRVVDPLA